MKIGIIGAGTVGTVLAKTFARGDHQIKLSRHSGAASLATRRAEFAANVAFVEVAEALQQPLVILAVPFEQAPAVLAQVADYKQRIVVDVTNQFTAPLALRQAVSHIFSNAFASSRSCSTVTCSEAVRMIIAQSCGQISLPISERRARVAEFFTFFEI